MQPRWKYVLCKCSLVFVFVSMLTRNMLQSELRLCFCAICHPAHFLPNRGLGQMERIQSSALVETVLRGLILFSHSTAYVEAYFRTMCWGKHLILRDLKI